MLKTYSWLLVINVDGAQETIWDGRNRSWVGYVQGKCPRPSINSSIYNQFLLYFLHADGVIPPPFTCKHILHLEV